MPSVYPLGAKKTRTETAMLLLDGPTMASSCRVLPSCPVPCSFTSGGTCSNIWAASPCCGESTSWVRCGRAASTGWADSLLSCRGPRFVESQQEFMLLKCFVSLILYRFSSKHFMTAVVMSVRSWPVRKSSQWLNLPLGPVGPLCPWLPPESQLWSSLWPEAHFFVHHRGCSPEQGRLVHWEQHGQGMLRGTVRALRWWRVLDAKTTARLAFTIPTCGTAEAAFWTWGDFGMLPLSTASLDHPAVP